MKRTLAVLLVLAGLGAYVYFVEIKGKQKEEKAEKTAKKLIPLTTPDLTHITIDNAGGRIELVKDGDAWRLAAPVSAPADESAVSSLVSSLTAAETKETIEGASDLAGFGLQPPKATLRVAGDGKEVTLLVGRKSPVSQDLYVMRQGEPAVLLVSGGLDANADRKADEYRDKRLFGFEANDVTAVTVVEGKDTLVVERNGDRWTIAKPQVIPADDTLAHGLAADLANLRATRWLVEAPTASDVAAQGLKTPAAYVTAKLTNGKTATARFGLLEGSDRSAMVEGRPQIVRIADWSVRNVLKRANDLRDRRLFPVDKARVAKLVFHTGSDKTITFQQTDGQWNVNDGLSSQMAKAESVDDLLTALTDFRATEFKASTPKDLKDQQLAPPLRGVIAYDGAGKTLATLAFGREEDGWAIWAQTDDKSTVAKASNDFVKNKWPSTAAPFGQSVTKP